MGTGKRVLFLLLALAVFAAVLTACGNGDESSAPESFAAESSQEVSETVYTYGPADYGFFPYADYKLNYSDPIRILCVSSTRHTYGEQQFVYNKEKEGNVINGAIQERNNLLEQEYGLTFEITAADYPSTEIANFIDSNLYEYDLICESVDRLVTGSISNYYVALDGYMDFSHPWWDAQAIESLALSDKHFLVAGAAILTDDDNTYLTLFNKDMYEANSKLSEYGNIYDIVREGKFTIDLYYEMCKQVSRPDTSGQWGFNATYGNLSHAYGANVMMNGCNIATVIKDEDNNLVLNVMTEQAVNAFDKVYELMSDQSNTQRAELIIGQSPNVQSTYGFAELEEMFVSGRGLFYNTTSASVSILKGTARDFEFGVLPIPKYNESQENYCNTVNRYQSSALAIPSNVPNARVPDVVFAMQALGFYNSDVIRAYYQTTLQLQAVTSDDDAEMLDLVYNNRFYDIGAIFGWGAGSGSLINLYGSVIADSASNTLASRWDSAESSVVSAMNQTLEAYNSYNN